MIGTVSRVDLCWGTVFPTLFRVPFAPLFPQNEQLVLTVLGPDDPADEVDDEEDGESDDPNEQSGENDQSEKPEETAQ